MATFLGMDGSRREIKPKNGQSFTLEEVYQIIGNGCDFVQSLPTRDGRMMLMDEEAKLRGQPIHDNLAANAELMGVIALDDTVVGNVLIVSEEEFE